MSVQSDLEMSVSRLFGGLWGATSMAVVGVSNGELRRLEVLRDVDRDGLPVRAAAQLLGRSERQVWRLLKAFRSAGAAGLSSKKRGQGRPDATPSPRGLVGDQPHVNPAFL